MKFMIQLLLVSLLGVASSVYAHGHAEKDDLVLDTPALLKLYADTWSIKDSASRLVALKKIWAKNGAHESPFGRSEGLEEINEEIGAFLNNFPGATLYLEDVKQTGNHIVCTFILKNADSNVILTGIDYFELKNNGRILNVIGFVK